MKWLLVLLILLGGGVAAAAFAVPTNAAIVNGVAISQDTLNSDISAIAGSPDYQCYLNSEDYLSSNGSQTSWLPGQRRRARARTSGDNPTANSTRSSPNYLDTEIGHQLVRQLAATRHVTVTPAQLTEARASLINQIDQRDDPDLPDGAGPEPPVQLRFGRLRR